MKESLSYPNMADLALLYNDLAETYVAGRR
ncbi:hypothetical protein BN874_1670003 [Candidatus Contendobacter odensis Run_B_J11]|uniref:Uncharacterized protein n=1 Tax=Candidatus Contendobacter odensis Run_B_J11 TaxID=1400861 RepID=A0A7U7GA85_9GAMM|nr:hypothetical protein BN874_1670003 [Candidatus Contendobacter odensis Run_B_J11]